MLKLAKALCLATFLLGLASALGGLPPSWEIAQTVALWLLAAHALEALLMWRHVRRYPGALWVSVGLTLLFGLLHWKPLADQARRA